VDAVVAALLLGRVDGVELVEAVDGHVAERHGALLVAFHQLGVELQRRAARREAQYEGPGLLVGMGSGVAADGLDDGVGHVLHALILVLVDPREDLFVTMDDVARCRFGDQPAVFGKRILVVHGMYGN
jgi:hypothetical protein